MANDRLTQEPVEVVLVPTDLKGRTTQVATEVLIVPLSKLRATQEVAEVLIVEQTWRPAVIMF